MMTSRGKNMMTTMSRTRALFGLALFLIAAVGSAACVSVYEESKQHCDEKCQKRARAGEVVIVTIVLVVALISGLACLGSLGTPTKFQQPARGRGTAS
mmetsp:Transcript_6347/g.21790  ORF Transcript_6347/g.21790 Transcript_6347/m.21790 type:complete len:98 (+) Transcript_6347:219-512(+)